MSEETNKEVEQVTTNNESFSEVVPDKIEEANVVEKPVSVAPEAVVEAAPAANTPVVEEPTSAQPVVETSVEETTFEVATPEVTSETVIEANVNQEVVEEGSSASGTIEEVTVQADSDAFNTLSETEVSENSIFNKKEEVTVTGMKEGQEHLNEKKGFPWFMVIVLILVIVVSFNVDKIEGLLQKIKESKKEPEVVEENKEEEKKQTAKELSLADIKKSLDSSSLVVELEKMYNIELNISVIEDKLILTTTDYLNIDGIDNLTVEFVHEKHILTANVEKNNSDFGKEMTILLIKEIGALQGMNTTELNNYLDENLYTTTLDKGFELTNSEDGNNSYRIMTNVIFKID